MVSIFGQRLFGNPGAGAFNQRPNVQLMDSSSTSLPSGLNAMADGELIQNFDRVLYTNLTSGSNQVYKASQVSNPQLGIQWTLEADNSSGQPEPKLGDILYVQSGVSNGEQLMGFNALSWQYLESALISASGAISANITGNVTGHASLDLPLTGGSLSGSLATMGLNIHVVNPAAGTYNLLATDSLVVLSHVSDIAHLPTATGSGKLYIIKNIAAGSVSVSVTGSDMIDGASSLALATQYNSAVLCDGAAGFWYELAAF